MKYNPYAYQERKGLKLISWELFHGICKGLAIAIAEFDPNIILGVARGGLYPATLISQILQKELYPVRLTRRVEDIVTYEHPKWLLKPPATINGLRVLVVDEICDTGETLTTVKTLTLETGASDVKCAVMYSHENSQKIPDYIGVITDELILNPWDREILRHGEYIFHPEFVSALSMQGMQAKESYLLGIRPEKPDKKPVI